MGKVSIRSVDTSNCRVLLRVDFNVPLHVASDGKRSVADDTRIRAAIPTLDRIVEGGGRAVLLSHLGRPKGSPDPAYSLAPVAQHLATLVNYPVRFLSSSTGEDVERAVDSLLAGSVLLLENTRFHEGETSNDPTLAAAWAGLADIYVNDAFGTAHRAHASTEGVAHLVDMAAMGFLLETEVAYLDQLRDEPKRPFVAVIGGAKVSDKIGIIESLLDSVDALLIGGAMAYTFLRALGVQTGTSLIEKDRIDLAAALLTRAGDKLILPTDHIVASDFSNASPHRTVSGNISADEMGLDIGPETIQTYQQILHRAGTIVWNGPMGVFEMPNFAKGTVAIAKALSVATENGALTVVGGGDSVAAVRQAGLESRVSHVSTGGGAMLEFLQGKTLPGIAALTDDD